MSGQPDLSTLPQRVRYAETVLGEVAEKLSHTRDHGFSRRMLLGIAERFEAEERYAAEREALVEELARALIRATYPWWPDDDPSLLSLYRLIARKLIESGWRKGDPA